MRDMGLKDALNPDLREALSSNSLFWSEHRKLHKFYPALMPQFVASVPMAVSSSWQFWEVAWADL